jgi:hypothetical protein
MKRRIVLATSLAFSAVALGASDAKAQGRCAATASTIDSARVEATATLFSDRPLAAELRREQGIPNSATQVAVSAVHDGAVCARLASQFGHVLKPSAKFAVLRVGPIYYARDPDQNHATGLFADSTFRVVMRLGAAVDK